MTARYCIVLLLAGGMLVSACKTKAPSRTKAAPSTNQVEEIVISDPPAKGPSPEETSRKAEALAHYATGVSYDLNDESDLALEEFYQSALLDPGNSVVVGEAARGLLQKDQNAKAIEILKLATQNAQAPGSLHGLLARAYLQSGETNQAIAASQAALKKAPDSITAYQSLAEIYLRAGKNQEVFKLLEQGSKNAKKDPVFLINLAELYGKYSEKQTAPVETVKERVLDLLARAREAKPQSPALLQKMAELYGQFGERDKAAEILTGLLTKYEDLPLYRDLLRQNLANVFLMGNDKDKAAEQFEAIIRDNPTKYPQVYFVLGTLAMEQKNWAKAQDYFGKVILISPELEQAYYELAAAHINSDQPTAALEVLDKARQKFPQNFVVDFYCGLALQKMKRYGDALKHYTAAEIIGKATDSKRLDFLFYFQLGACAERNHDYEQAEKYFLKSLELKPDEPETLNYLGYMWTERDTNLEKAREFIEKAVKAEPKNGAFLDSMGWVLYKLKQPDKALSYLLQATQHITDPDPTVFDHLGDVYQALNQPDKAREFWQKSLQIEQSDNVKKKLGLSL